MARTPGQPAADSGHHRLALGIAVSLLAHVAIFVTLVVAPPQSRASHPLAQHPENEEEKPPDSEVTLGDPDSQVTSISWIGYDELVEQYSTEPSTIDQPQLTRSPRAPVPTSVETAQTTTSPPAPREQAAAESLADASDQAEAQPEASDSSDQTLATVVGPPIDLAGEIAIDRALGVGLPSNESELTQDSPAEVENVEKTQPARRPAEAAPAPTADDPGDQSDRDVPFAARFVASESELGKPLQGKGIYVMPVKPKPTDYSHVTRALRSPRNPVFNIFFRRDGTVDRVEIAETSKVDQVDSALLNLLYRWRARGPQLDSLQEGTENEKGETLPIEIRILLQRR